MVYFVGNKNKARIIRDSKAVGVYSDWRSSNTPREVSKIEDLCGDRAVTASIVSPMSAGAAYERKYIRGINCI